VKKVFTHCFECSHECKLELEFEDSDSIEYVKDALSTFGCPSDNAKCKWKHIGIEK
jgi:hypothetical protein